MWRKSQVSLFNKYCKKILSFVDNPVLQMGFVIQKVESVIVTPVGWVIGAIYVEEKSSKPV